jgi:adenine-specific DNA-methyltransferase
MPTAFERAFGEVKDLVADFKANESYYLSPQFSEAQTRKDFIDKFFIALGWDVNHDNQKNPYAQEVKIEKNESITQGRADYAFSLSPSFRDVRFFVEAKKPHGEFGSADNYFQALRYGWGSKTPLVVLTNFDEFHILDSRYKPHIGDTLSRVVKKFSYNDYADSEKFAEIYWLLSREAVSDNSLTKRAEELPRPKSKTLRRELFKGGGQSPDEAFLIELDGYRKMLARAFKSKNPNLNSAQLTEITQRVIDRLVFIRFLEDKQIEPTRHVERFGADGGSVWEDFLGVSVNLDRTYNGVVFKRHEILDAPGFQIDEKPFRIICEELADPNSPYNFATIPIHILGSIYERFLGKIITDGARIVEKPEVRKAGGVYYTPEYIVRYIVANTVGQAVEGKTPADIAGMRFADIACGSGSFLLEVFDLLVRWHAKFYNENPGKAKKGDCVQRDDGLHLSLKKKQEILRNNIYGVDIDRQAVEVAQLSLDLKLLEDETIGSAAAFQNEFHFTLLPSLADNIVCGNSLIGTDILETGNFTPEEERKLNPMDFEQRFPRIFRRKTSGGELHDAPTPFADYTLPGVPLHGAYAKVSYKKKKGEKPATPPEVEYEGGFDAIVGNPPYVLLQDDFRDTRQLKYLRQHYKCASFKLDTYHLFIERGIRLCRANGRLSLITPSNFLTNNHLDVLRRFILEKTQPEQLVVIEGGVFPGVSVDNAVFVFRAGQSAKAPFPLTRATAEKDNFNPTGQDQIFPERVLCEKRALLTSGVINPAGNLWDALSAKCLKLAEVADVNFGKQLRDRKKFTKDVIEVGSRSAIPKTHVACVTGKDVGRYLFRWSGLACLTNTIAQCGGCWDESKHNAKGKLLTRQIGRYPVFALDSQGYHCLNTLFMVTVSETARLKPTFLLGVLNSKLLRALWMARFYDQRRTFPKIKGTYLKELPIALPDFKNPAEKMRHDKLVSLVERMMEARRQLAAAKTDGDQIFYSNKCAGLDGQIDALVYELYGLSSEEIKIVEGEKESSVGQPLSKRAG